MDARFSIAHVSPYPWEAHENEVNAHIAQVCAELSRRGHRVLVLAPSQSQERVRDSRRELRAARGRPQALLEGADGGTPRVIAVGEVIDVAAGSRRRHSALSIDVARTIEELLSTVELDFVHVHEPFAPSTASAALRHSRALNVGSFHSSSERLLSTLVARRFVESFFGRLDARTASTAETAALMQRHFPGDYKLLADDSAAAERFEQIYARLAARRHAREGDAALASKLSARPLIDVDLHMHTDHSGDCATPVEVLLATARAQGLG
ncbi:MAG TPA: glycosyltransferase, partial [Polyangia bacterium]|nr:glycosyltransferase [Polyangia bacterium]